MHEISTLPYYTSTSLRSGYANGGLSSLRPGYIGGGFIKKITRPIAKVLDKIVPNEIKPALPFLAAATPFLAGYGFLGQTLGSLTPAQSALLGAGANVIGQASQEGAAKYGINPLSVGLAALGGAFAAPNAGTEFGLMKSNPFNFGIGSEADAIRASMATTGDLSSGINSLSYTTTPPNIDFATGTVLDPGTSFQYNVPPSTLDTITNTLASIGEKGSEVFEKGRTALGKGDIFTKDFAMATLPGQATAAGDLAYNKAAKALDEFDKQQATLGAMGVANTEARRAAVRKAMGLSDFTESEIQSALTRLGLAFGGRVKYGSGDLVDKPKSQPIPINPEMLALAIYDKRYDELTYTQKNAIDDMLSNKKAKGGIMNLGGKEMDLRAAGGFVPIGKKERADDVPARLSKNEFVFTAKAVRNAGGGDIKKGAKKMYQLMKQYEAMA